MKTKLFFIAVCMMCAANMVAQSDDSDYLDRAMKELNKENCKGAQKWYDAYKEVSGQSKPSVQALIDECKKGGKSYVIGDKIIVEGKIYKVAYIEDGGRHGFAVCENGSGRKPDNAIIPTWSEFKLIKKANKTLKLCGRYWSTRAHSESYYYVYGLGGRSNDYYDYKKINDILLIYRF